MRKKRAVLNIIFSLGGQLLTIVSNLFLRSVLIGTLGSEYLGLNGLFSNIISILSLAELGIGAAITYTLYNPIAIGNTQQINSIMNLFKKLYLIISCVIAALGLLITPFLGFFINNNNTIEHIQLFFLLYTVNTIATYTYIYKSLLLIADQKKYIVLSINNISVIVKAVMQILVLIYFKSYILYLIIQIVSTLITNLAISGYVDKHYKFIHHKAEKLSNDLRQSIKKNVMAMLLHQSSTVVVNSTDSLIISKVLGLVYTGYYSNYALVFNTVITMNSMIMGSLTAGVGNYIVTESKSKSVDLFYKIFFMNSWVTGFSAIALLCLINPFIELWFGKDYLLSNTCVILLALCFYFRCMRGAVLAFRDALGLYRPDQYKAVLEMIINLIVSIYLVHQWGIEGVFAGTLISTVVTCTWMEPFVLFKFGFCSKGLITYFAKYLIHSFVIFLTGIMMYMSFSYFLSTGLYSFIVKIFLCIIFPNIVFLLFSFRSGEFVFYWNIIRSYLPKKDSY